MHDIDRTLSLAEIQDASDDELNELETIADMDEVQEMEAEYEQFIGNLRPDLNRIVKWLTKHINRLKQSSRTKTAIKMAIIYALNRYLHIPYGEAKKMAEQILSTAEITPTLIRGLIAKYRSKEMEFEFNDEMDFEDEFEMPDDNEYSPRKNRRTSSSGRWIRRGNKIILLGA